MSGEAGATRQGRYVIVRYLSGIVENIALPPGEKNQNYPGETFAKMSLPYEETLARAMSGINSFFTSLIGNKDCPIVQLNPDCEWVYGIIIEDGDTTGRKTNEEAHGKTWFDAAKGEKGAFILVDIPLENFKHAELTFAVNAQIKRSAIDFIKQNIITIFKAL